MPRLNLVIFSIGMMAALCSGVAQAQASPMPTPGTIRSVAGGGEGDGGSALQASVYSPQGIARDRAGNLYISDAGRNSIRKVTPEGIISRYAGGKNPVLFRDIGDGGLAIDAVLSQPQGLATDSIGNLYIAEFGGSRIRKVTPDGIISTLAGTGYPPKSANDVGVTLIGNGGPATSVQLLHPTDVALDRHGNLFLADQYNNRIRKVDPHGIITIVAGSGTFHYSDIKEGLRDAFTGDGGLATEAHFYFPAGIAVGADDSLYIADTLNNRIRKVDPQGIVTTIAGTGQIGPPVFMNEGGDAREAQIGLPLALSLDDEGNLFFTSGYGWVQKIDSKGKITTIAGNGEPYETGQIELTRDGISARQTRFYGAYDLLVDRSNGLLVTDALNSRVQRINSAGILSTVVGTGGWAYAGENIPATEAQLNGVSGLSFDQAGNLYLSDKDNFRIRKIDTKGIITRVAGIGPFSHYGDSAIGGFSGDGGPALNALFESPDDVAVSPTGELWISDTGNHRIRRITADGTLSTVAGVDAGTDANPRPGDFFPELSKLNTPLGIAFDPHGDLLVADSKNNRIRKIDLSGTLTNVAGTGGFRSDGQDLVTHLEGDGGLATQAALNMTNVVDADAHGNVYFGDESYLRTVSTDGILNTLQWVGLIDVAIDSAGQIFAARWSDVVRIERNGQIITVAGKRPSDTLNDAPKDGDLATNAPFNNASHLAIDASGNLWVSDSGFNRIYEVFGVAAPGRVGGHNLPGNGDVNRDGVVDIADAVRALSASVQNVQMNAVESAFGDTNADGVLNLQDVTQILRRAVGL